MEVPSKEIRDAGPVSVEGVVQDEENLPVMDIQLVDQDFIHLLDINLLAGKNFSLPIPDDAVQRYKANPVKYLTESKREYIINKTALKQLGFNTPEEVIGRNINWSIGEIELKKGPVVGVIEDYHQENLRNSIDPVVMTIEPYWIGNLILKLDGNDIQQTMTAVEDVWKTNFPEFQMEYTFVDELYNSLYRAEKKQLELIYLFSTLAIGIAFLGIFSLLTYTIRAREKEIAIRQVLGAGYSSLVILLSKPFMVITLGGILLAVPVTVYLMNEWLQTFVYRIPLQATSFIIAIASILVILFATVGLQIFRSVNTSVAEILYAE